MRQLQLDRHAAQQAVRDEGHAGALRQVDIAIDRHIDGESAVACEVIMDLIHLAHLMAADIDSRLFLQAVQVAKHPVVTICRGEDIHPLEVVKSEEKQE